MDKQWVTPREAAVLTGLSPHGVRHRLRRDSEELINRGLARLIPASDDGGRDRWEISAELLQEWASAEVGRTDAHYEELDMARREAKVFEVALERARGENEAATLRAERDALSVERDALKIQVAGLRQRLKALGENYATAVLALTSIDADIQ